MMNAASTLEELVAPLTETEFLALLRERKLIHVRSANDGSYARLMGWEALRRLFEQGQCHQDSENFRVIKESVLAPIERWTVDGKADTARLEECLADGFSIVLTHIEQFVPPLWALCRTLSERLQERSFIGVVVTTGAEGAFRVHFDPEDLVILQVEGTKRWQIFGPPVLNPVRGMAKQPAPQGDPVFDQVLEPGDLLFVPAGHWHHCQTMSGKSIHLGIFLIPPTGWHAARALASKLVAEELFRTPLTRIEDAAQLAALEAEVKRHLIEKVSTMTLGDYPAEWASWNRKQNLSAQAPGDDKVTSGAELPSRGPASTAPSTREVRSGMTCSFLENLSLQTLIAPFPAEEFRTRYWEQQPLIVQRGNPDFYGNLFTLDDFDAAITRAPEYVKLANAESKKNISYKPMGQGLEAVLADMRNGGTLVLDALHKTDPKLSLLCRGLAPELGHRFQTNLYLTPPRGRGFTPHWDNHDVFILQVLGSKHWKIEGTRRKLPAPGESMGDDGRELRGELISCTLRQGDLIYIPRGWVHAAECGEEPSLHVTYGVSAFLFEELLSAAIKEARRRDESLAAALPLGFMQGSGADLVRRLKAALIEMCDDKFLTEVVERYRDELVGTFALDISGQVRDFFRPRPVMLDDVVEPRPGAVYRMHIGEDSVRVNFGSRVITFLGLFRDALDFALKTPAYAVREIKGDLQDEERVVFVERLLEEGLVVRKANGSA